jgi:hypothetical protein
VWAGFEPGTVICATAIEIMVSSSGSKPRTGRRDSPPAYSCEPAEGKRHSRTR